MLLQVLNFFTKPESNVCYNLSCIIYKLPKSSYKYFKYLSNLIISRTAGVQLASNCSDQFCETPFVGCVDVLWTKIF